MDEPIRYVILKPIPAAPPHGDQWRASVILPSGQRISAAGGTQTAALHKLAVRLATAARASPAPTNARPHASHPRIH